MGYEPKMQFKDGLKVSIDWFKDNWDEIEKSASFHLECLPHQVKIKIEF